VKDALQGTGSDYSIGLKALYRVKIFWSVDSSCWKILRGFVNEASGNETRLERGWSGYSVAL
jgi:hypothetical protein